MVKPSELALETEEALMSEASADGRWNIACAFLCFFAMLGIPAIMFPTLYGPIMDDTGWTRGEVSLMTSVKFGIGAIAAYFTGPLVEKIGVRIVTIGCGILSGSSLLLMFVVESLPVFYLVGAMLGISALGLTTAMKIFISHWFEKNQGLAIGIALMGTSIAGVTVPYTATLLNEEFGWRMTCVLMSLFVWFVALPFFVWKAKEHPSQKATNIFIPRAEKEAKSDLSGPTFAEIRYSKNFIIALCIAFFIGFVDHGMSAHLVVYFDRDVNMGAELAAIAFSVVMIMSNIGKIAFGWLFDSL